jgi:hypothetical protein
MPHVEVRNHTPFAYESLVLTDEEGIPQFVPLVQATFSIAHTGQVSLLEERQPPPNIGGEWYGDPATTSLKLEPQIAFNKPATDVVLLGHAYAPAPGANETQVGIRIGPLSKVARVVGDRVLVSRSGVTSVSRPQPFETIPLVYERAFGGWDRRDPNPAKQRCEPRNPVGVGFRANALDINDELALPNIEHVDQPFRACGDTPQPAGFGFLAPNWHPRLAFAGTYDDAWEQERKPLLPRDFDRRFFNAASVGLVAPGYLTGTETVTIIGATPQGRIEFALPAVPSPECIVEVRGRRRVSLPTRLDTVIVDMDRYLLTLMWRAHLATRNGPHDVLSVDVQAPGPV